MPNGGLSDGGLSDGDGLESVREMARKTLVVLPTYNEAENLAPLVEAIFAQGDYHILVVDDNSTDGTGRLADALGERHPDRLDVLHRPAKAGLGRAYVAGFETALARGFSYVVQMDCDLSHDPRYLPDLLLSAGRAGVAIGSRYVEGGETRGWPLRRRVISRGGSLYTRLVLGMDIRDLTSGYKAFRRDVLARLDVGSIGSTGFGFQVETSWRCWRLGYQAAEVPIVFADRRAGQSKMSSEIFWEALVLVWRLRLKDTWTPRRGPVPA